MFMFPADRIVFGKSRQTASLLPSRELGEYGYSGDGGPATQAKLYDPCGLEVDPSGNLYIADMWNDRVRKVTPDGIISTVAGNGSQRVSGDPWTCR